MTLARTLYISRVQKFLADVAGQKLTSHASHMSSGMHALTRPRLRAYSIPTTTRPTFGCEALHKQTIACRIMYPCLLSIRAVPPHRFEKFEKLIASYPKVVLAHNLAMITHPPKLSCHSARISACARNAKHLTHHAIWGYIKPRSDYGANTENQFNIIAHLDPSAHPVLKNTFLLTLTARSL